MKKYLFSEQDFGYIPPGSSPQYNSQNTGGASGLAIACASCGVLTLIGCWCCWLGFFGIIPIILGFIELSKIKNGTSSPAGKVFCIIGIITGALAFLLTILLTILSVGLNLFQKYK